jgi:hypothetical protein
MEERQIERETKNKVEKFKIKENPFTDVEEEGKNKDKKKKRGNSSNK